MPSKTLLISVGGSPAPIIHSIKKLRPGNVIFFVSPGTRAKVAKEILPALGEESQWPAYKVVLTPDEQDVGASVFALMEKVPEALQKLDATETNWPSYVDYTGGTKTMSAAVVWASSRFPCEMIYVGTNRNAVPKEGRTKGGVGIVRSGQEFIFQRENPWNRIGFIEARSAVEAFNGGQYGVATGALERLAQKVTESETNQLFDILAKVFRGFYCWDIFDHKLARQALGKWLEKLQPLTEQSQSRIQLPGLSAFLQDVQTRIPILDDLVIGKRKGWSMACDLLANARRRGELEQKYEDAVARCYSAIEKAAQFELLEKYGIDNGKAKPEQIPENLREDYRKRYTRKAGLLEFGLRPTMTLLHHLEIDNGAKSIGRRFDSRPDIGKKHLDERNHSILAHGAKPMTQKQYRDLFEDALYLFDMKESELTSFPLFSL
jgi:CRISPR-associated protein (TIGR02710 family)